MITLGSISLMVQMTVPRIRLKFTGGTSYGSANAKSLSPSTSSGIAASTTSSRNLSYSSTSRPIFTDPVFSTTYSGQAMPRPDEIAAASKKPRSDIVMEQISMRYASTVAAQAGLSKSVDTSGLSILQRSAKFCRRFHGEDQSRGRGQVGCSERARANGSLYANEYCFRA